MSIKKGNNYIATGGSLNVGFSDITGQPTDNTNLATALNAKANDSDVVKLAGEQTITGVKNFTAVTREKAPRIRNYTDDYTTAPSEQQYYQWGCEDKNGVWLGGFEANHLTNGDYTKGMYVRNQNGSSYASIQVGITPAGSAYTFAPTPATSDNSTQIATTAFVNNKLNSIPHIVETYQNGTSWYRVYSDGWCEQGGVNTGTGGSQTTTFLKPFSSTNYVLHCINHENTTAAWSNRFGFNKTITGFTNYNNNGVSWDWYACGYIS